MYQQRNIVISICIKNNPFSKVHVVIAICYSVWFAHVLYHNNSMTDENVPQWSRVYWKMCALISVCFVSSFVEYSFSDHCSDCHMNFVQQAFLQITPFQCTNPFTNRARALCKTLISDYFSLARALAYVERTHAFFVCIYSGRIKSPKKSGYVQYSDTTECDRSKLSQYDPKNARTLVQTFYNNLYTSKTDARYLKVVRWIVDVYSFVLWPSDCCSTCLM